MFKLLATGAILVAVGLGLTIVGGVISGEGLTMYHGYSDYEMADPYVSDAAGIGTVSIQVENRRVVVEPALDDQITITYTESDRDTIEITNVGGVITLTNDVEYWFWFTMNFGMMASIQERTVSVAIPATLALDLDVETTNGSLSVADLPEVTSLALDSVNGAVTMTNLTGLDSLVAETTNGVISLDNVTVSGSIDLVATNGGVTMSNLTGLDSLVVETTSGVISLNNVTVSGSIDLATSAGAINLDDVTCPDIQATTTSGNIDGNDVTGEDVTFHATTGAVNLEIHGALADFYVRLSTVQGSMYINNSKVTQNAYNTNLPNKLDLATTFGDVHLNFVA